MVNAYVRQLLIVQLIMKMIVLVLHVVMVKYLQELDSNVLFVQLLIVKHTRLGDVLV